MNLLRKNIYKLLLTGLLSMTVFSCDYDLDINVDPNNPTEGQLDLLLPTIEVSWAYTYQNLNDVTQGIMGLTSNSDLVDFDQNSFNGTWTGLYSGLVKDLDEYIKVASETNEAGALLQPRSLGLGQVMKAFVYSAMVDLWGDVPYSEASTGNSDEPIFNPAFDNQQEIYADLLRLLDEGIANLEAAGVNPGGDFIYNGNASKWVKAAKSLKLKLLMQVRRAPSFSYGAGISAEVTALINENDLITSNADDMQFRYTSDNSRGENHPWWGAVFGGDNAFSYIMHQFMFEMLANQDPRLPYYFKRQTTSVLDQEDDTQRNTTPCSQNSFCKYGYLVLSDRRLGELAEAGVISDPPTDEDIAYIAGFFGRDKGDPSGIPLDGALRTAPGVYPMGGIYDGLAPSKLNSSDGIGLGDGITQFITANMVRLYKIEAILELGAPGDARALYEEFIRASMDKVETFSLSVSNSGAVAMDEDEVEAYVAARLEVWDNSNNKLRTAMKESWYAYWGSGMELYNNFRRTGFPDDIQVPTFREAAPGQRNFPIRFPYTRDEINLNTNIDDFIPSDGDEGIFWDVIKYKYPI